MSNQQLAIRSDEMSVQEIALAFVKSGYFQDSRDVSQAIVKIIAGREFGFGAFASMTGLYIIQGRPAIGANLMASAVKRSARYDYRVRELSEKGCTVEFYERIGGKLESLGTSAFSLDDARKAGTKNLDKFARNMLFARAMSNGVRWYCPDVFSGAAVYTPEELGAVVNDDGQVIDGAFAEAQPVEQPQAQPVQAQPVARPVMSYNDAYVRVTKNGTQFGTMTVDQLELVRGHSKSSAEDKEAANILLEAIAATMEAEALLVDEGISENVFAARGLLAKVPQEIVANRDALVAWGKTYRAWRHAGEEPDAAAERAASGEQPSKLL